MANKSENAEIAVLQSQMETNTATLTRVEGKVDALISKVDTVSLLQVEINTLKTAVAELKQSKFKTGVVYPTLAAIAGAVISGLIILVIAGK